MGQRGRTGGGVMVPRQRLKWSWFDFAIVLMSFRGGQAADCSAVKRHVIRNT